jgi:hypothetical protein
MVISIVGGLKGRTGRLARKSGGYEWPFQRVASKQIPSIPSTNFFYGPIKAKYRGRDMLGLQIQFMEKRAVGERKRPGIASGPLRKI